MNCLPFYRQEKDWVQLGIKLNRGTLANWFNTCAEEYLEPVYDRLHKYLLQQPVIHADETTCQVLKEDDKAPESKSYIWLYTSGAFEEHRIVIYEYQPSKSCYHAVKFLADFHGFIHTDGLAVTTVCRTLTGADAGRTFEDTCLRPFLRKKGRKHRHLLQVSDLPAATRSFR